MRLLTSVAIVILEHVRNIYKNRDKHQFYYGYLFTTRMFSNNLICTTNHQNNFLNFKVLYKMKGYHLKIKS